MIYERHDWLNHKFFKCTGEGSIISCFFSRNDKQLLCWNYKLGPIRLKLKQNKQATKCKRSQGFLFSLFSILVLKKHKALFGLHQVFRWVVCFSFVSFGCFLFYFEEQLSFTSCLVLLAVCISRALVLSFTPALTGHFIR